MLLKAEGLYVFGPYRLDARERQLTREGEAVPLPPKALDLLIALVVRAGHLVSKEELLREVWADTFVEEANLSYTISLLRKALGDEPERYIETVPKRGYRFRQPVSSERPVATLGSSPTSAAPLQSLEPATDVHQTSAGSKRWWVSAAATGLILAGAAAAWLVSDLRHDPPSPVVRLALIPPKGVSVENVQISPDGRRIAFIGWDVDRRRRLWLQALDSTEATPVTGKEGAQNPFWAPDSQQLAFESGGALKKINMSGGPPQTLYPGVNITGTWSRENVILAHLQPWGRPVPARTVRISAVGGVPTNATTLDQFGNETSRSSLQFLPDGRHFLYVAHSADPALSRLYVRSLDSPDLKRLLDIDTAAIYASPGYLLFSRDGAIVAQPFDEKTLELRGEAVPVAEDEDYRTRVGAPQFSTSSRIIPGFGLYFTNRLLGAATFSASQTGVLAYSLLEPDIFQFEWVDREGKPLGNVGPPGPYRTFALSSDGKRLAFTRGNVDRANIWILDLERNVPSQVTFGRKFQFDARWAPDGQRLAATVVEDGRRRILEIAPDGKESVRVDRAAFLDDCSPDGRFLLFHRVEESARVLEAAAFDGKGEPVSVRRAHIGTIDQSRFSPDSRLIAYDSDESGRSEIYVSSFPPTGERVQVSTDGGYQPVWRRDGRELFFLRPDGMLSAVSIQNGKVDPSGPRALFRPALGPITRDTEQYTTIDGTRFLVLKLIERPQRPISVTINWPATINRAGSQ